MLCCGDGGLVANLCPTLATLWAVAHQAPLSMGFPRQEYWRGLPFPSPGDSPDSGIESGFPALQADSLLTVSPGKPLCYARSFILLEDVKLIKPPLDFVLHVKESLTVSFWPRGAAFQVIEIVSLLWF